MGTVRVIRRELSREYPPSQATRNPFRYFNSSPEVIRLKVMMYICYALSLRQVEDLLFERGIGSCQDTEMVLVEPLRFVKTPELRVFRHGNHGFGL